MTSQHIDPELLEEAQRFLAESEAAHADIARRLLAAQHHPRDLYALYWEATRLDRPYTFYWSRPGYGERCVRYARALATALVVCLAVVPVNWRVALGAYICTALGVGFVWVLDCLAGVKRMSRRRR